jgi:hypothetical protein
MLLLIGLADAETIASGKNRVSVNGWNNSKGWNISKGRNNWKGQSN